MSIIGNLTTVPVYPGDLHVEGNYTVTGDATIYGDLRVFQNTYVSTDTYVTDPITVVNYLSGAPVSGVETRYSGLEVDRGLLTNYQFVFDENDDSFRVGEVGDLQAVATREDNPILNAFPYWNNTAKRFDTTATFTTATMVTFSDLTYANLQAELDPHYINTIGGTMVGDLNFTNGSTVNLQNFGSDENLLRCDPSGDIVESGLKVSNSPVGGSGIAIMEYASEPTLASCPVGFIWAQAVNATTKKICFYNGTDVFSVELYKQ